MASSQFTIAVVGAGKSGRHTTLHAILKAAKASYPPVLESGVEYWFNWPSGGSTRVAAFVIGARGQDSSAASDVRLLRQADGVIFVWDGQASRTEQNREALDRFQADGGVAKPLVVLVNKRDLMKPVSPAILQDSFGPASRTPRVDGVANKGEGCEDALTRLLGLLEKAKR